MEKFTIKIGEKEFTFEKNRYENYKVTPFDDTIEIQEISDALRNQMKYYISGCGIYAPVQINEKNEDGEKPKPFDIREKCYFVLISKSGINNIVG